MPVHFAHVLPCSYVTFTSLPITNISIIALALESANSIDASCIFITDVTVFCTLISICIGKIVVRYTAMVDETSRDNQNLNSTQLIITNKKYYVVHSSLVLQDAQSQ